MAVAKKYKQIKKGKGWNLKQVIVSGNYVVSYAGKEFIYHPDHKKFALAQIESIKKVYRVLSKVKGKK